MSKRLSITISGAVSLGSYEAGVLYETLSALAQHNQDPKTPDDEKVYVDVITGASAGGMTAAIAAQKLLYEGDALNAAYDNSFYRAWVAEISIQRLLELHGHDAPTMSVLSSQTVVDISEKLLTDRYTTHLTPPGKRHPAVDPENLSLGLALANLNGVDYSLPVLPSGAITYTRHKDEFIRRFPDASRAADDNGDLWEALRAAAVSCGAFPFAFRVVELVRLASEYELPNLAKPLAPTENFAYTDGGTFQNEPISLAKRLVDEIDDHRDLEERFFLFVAPDLKGSAANSDFNDGNARFLATAKRLFGAIFNQARFPDLVLAEENNREIQILNRRAEELAGMLKAADQAALDLAKNFGAACAPLLAALFRTASVTSTQEGLDAARDRLRNQFGSTYNALDPRVRDAWIDCILTLERAAGLEETDEMTIYSVTATDDELAGADLMAFGGFMDRSYRDHDYDVGREKAQAFLRSPGVFGLPGGIRFTPAPNREKDSNLDGLKVKDMDRGLREQVRDQILDRFNTVLKDIGVSGFLIGPALRAIADEVVKPKLNKILGL